MLTPVGMIHNLLISPNHELAPYYFKSIERTGFQNFPELAVVAGLVALVSVIALRQMEGRK